MCGYGECVWAHRYTMSIQSGRRMRRVCAGTPVHYEQTVRERRRTRRAISARPLQTGPTGRTAAALEGSAPTSVLVGPDAAS